jgi:hypothetical protein
MWLHHMSQAASPAWDGMGMGPALRALRYLTYPSPSLTHRQFTGGSSFFSSLDTGHPAPAVASVLKHLTIGNAPVPQVPNTSRTTYDKLGKICSNGTNVEIINNGHAIQVEWMATAGKPAVSIAVPSKSLHTLHIYIQQCIIVLFQQRASLKKAKVLLRRNAS